MLQVNNHTPFVPGLFVFPDEEAVDTLVLVLKATFTLGQDRVSIADEQKPIQIEDTYSGEPGRSSLLRAGEAHLPKPATDVVLIGDAFAPGGKPTPMCVVRVVVGPVSKLVQVFGDRVFRTGLAGQRPTSPEPFLRVPLRYERAFGGVDDTRGHDTLYEPRNPSGVGFRGRRSGGAMEGVPLPNLEDPRNLITTPGDRPMPVGFGFIAPTWEPRRAFAGTYDERWRTTRAPYLPLDFNSRFFTTASPDLVCPGFLTGGEPVELANVSPIGIVSFRLPRFVPRANVLVRRSMEQPSMFLDTVLFEPNDGVFSLLFRGALRCDKRILQVESVTFDVDSIEGVTEGI